MRNPALIERHELAIDHRIAFDTFESFCDFDVIVADDLAVAAVERDLAAFGDSDHPKAVVFVFKDPVLIVERRIRQRGKHRLQAFWQRRGPGHYDALPSRTLRNVME